MYSEEYDRRRQSRQKYESHLYNFFGGRKGMKRKECSKKTRERKQKDWIKKV